MRKGRNIIIYIILVPEYFFPRPKPPPNARKTEDAPKAAIILGGEQLTSWINQAFGQCPDLMYQASI
jgi:hypothetical protein